jgi:hypothetical protein
MGDTLDTCAACNGPQIEIERFGGRFVGCIECNWWTWPTSESLSMALTEEDLEALSAHIDRR